MALVQRLLSFQDPGSELSRLNRARGAEIALHPIAARVLRLARAATRASGGLFNCTVGGALVRRRRLPGEVTSSTLDAGNASDIRMRGRRARLIRPVLVTLDGIAKGYAVDLAVASLMRSGVAAGWVNAGGDLRAFGDICVPVCRRDLDGRLVMLGSLAGGAVATSRFGGRADERFPGFIIGDRPPPRAASLWTVLARRAWQADAMTKCAALAPCADRRLLLERFGGRLLAGG